MMLTKFKDNDGIFAPPLVDRRHTELITESSEVFLESANLSSWKHALSEILNIRVNMNPRLLLEIECIPIRLISVAKPDLHTNTWVFMGFYVVFLMSPEASL